MRDDRGRRWQQALALARCAHAVVLGVALGVAACGDAPEPAPLESTRAGGDASQPLAQPAEPAVPATAKLERYRDLLAFKNRPRHPADGAGRAWLEREPGRPAVSATPDRFRIVFEVGPRGIARGGMLLFRAPRVGGWSAPQADRPAARGYAEVGADAEDVELRTSSDLATKSLAIEVVGRALRPGEHITLVYGAGPGYALVGRYAQRDARLWLAVDGDGDGAYGFLADSPAIDVVPGRPAALLAVVPSSARPGDALTLRLAVVDAHRNAIASLAGPISLKSAPPGLALPAQLTLAGDDDAPVRVPVRAAAAGVFRIEVRAAGLRATSNPIVVSDDAPTLLWGELHGHSAFSDGTGTPEDYFRYARDTAGLDVAALTDHDHLGVLALDEQPARWREIQRQAERFHAPGHFVTLLGFEWTNWIHGHRHVLYFEDEGPLLSALDPAFATPQQLWRGLAGHEALTFAHHSAGGPVAGNWDIPPDPRFEPVTEIASIHGSSEAADAPVAIENPVAGNFVRDALDRGYRLGFVGSGDTHDGHPGVTQLGYRAGGLAAIWAEERTREAVLAALRARRVYATSGPRIWLRVTLAGRPMGAPLPVAGGETTEDLVVHVVGTASIERIDLVRTGAIVESIPGTGDAELQVRRSVRGLSAGEYLYVRAVQKGSGTAWSSPFFAAE